MSWTNTTLTTAIQDYLDSSESSLVTNIPNFIQATEEKILKSVQLDLFRKNVTGNATASNTYLTMPTDFLSPFSLALIDSSGDYNYLLLKHVSFIRDYTPSATTSGTSKYYAEFDETTFILAPAPSTNFEFELHYFYRPTSLTATSGTDTTWLSTNAINAMLYGCLSEACMYLKNYEAIPLYEQKLQESLVLLKNLGEAKSTRDQYRYGEIRREPQA
tara:strand:+ start:21 stop:671 length:651 start_codon:yes stop_codon:yes gene_type:complete